LGVFGVSLVFFGEVHRQPLPPLGLAEEELLDVYCDFEFGVPGQKRTFGSVLGAMFLSFQTLFGQREPSRAQTSRAG